MWAKVTPKYFLFLGANITSAKNVLWKIIKSHSGALFVHNRQMAFLILQRNY